MHHVSHPAFNLWMVNVRFWLDEMYRNVRPNFVQWHFHLSTRQVWPMKFQENSWYKLQPRQTQPHLCLLRFSSQNQVAKKLEEQFSRRLPHKHLYQPRLKLKKTCRKSRIKLRQKTIKPPKTRDMCFTEVINEWFRICWHWLLLISTWRSFWTRIALELCGVAWFYSILHTKNSFISSSYGLLQPLFFQHMWEEQQVST